jgi:hypothetical protein
MAKAAEVVEDAKALERRFFDTLTAANSHKAKPAAVKAFRDALRECERAGAVPWGRLKDPLGAARQIVLEKAKAVLGPAVPEVWDAQADRLRGEMGYAEAPALERTLIEAAVLCWIRLAAMELHYSGVLASNTTFKHVEHTERRLTEAQKRFNRACEALARVRRLSRPKVQINVAAAGGQQVNVA